MNVLIIANDIGITAPGIVYETIIKELGKYINVYVMTLSSREGMILPYKYIPTVPKGWEHPRISKLFFSIFSYNLFDNYWLHKQKKNIDTNAISQCDIIISFTSFHNYKSIILGEYLSDRYNKKWIIYSVDAIPAPIGWVNDGGFYRNLKIYISKYIERCDAFFSSNEQMLRYQLEGVKNPPLYNGVIYTPIRDIAITSCEKTTSSPVFLYTGGIYGPRKKEALLDGFRMLLNDYPNAQLLFVGIGNNHNFETYNDLISTGNIRICDYVQDLSMYYNQATALIDINAYFDNDVFLSSKVVNYLTIPKPIISITGYNSPSRNIFRESKSIIHSSHNPHTIYQALLKSINMNLDILKDRQMYINKFSAESIVREFMSVLYKI